MLEFGPFQLDLQQKLLLRDGRPVQLPPKALLILCVLAEQPEKLVERYELMKRVWPDTHVEEGNLSVNIFALRKALAEGMDGTPVIETIPRRGYRFVAPLRKSPPPTIALPDPPPVKASSKRAAPYKMIWMGAPVLAASLLALAVTSGSPTLRVGRVSQLTHFGFVHDIGTDGERLYFTQEIGSRTVLAETPMNGGDPVPIDTPVQEIHLLDVSAVRKELLVRGKVGAQAEEQAWILPLRGGSPRPLGKINPGSARWSADGGRIAYQLNGGLYVVSTDGTGVRKVTDRGGSVDAWSPDGKLIRFTRTDDATGGQSIWEIRADGSGLRAVLARRQDPNARWREGQCCGRWTPDGSYFLFREAGGGNFSMWALPERGGFAAWREPQPIKLYSAGFDFPSLAVTPDGKRVVLGSWNESRETVEFDRERRQWVPLRAQIAASGLRWSPDGKWIAYTSFPDLCLWRVRADGTERLQLTFPPTQVFGLAWSADGSRLAIHELNPGQPGKIALVGVNGGKPDVLLAAEHTAEDAPTWLPDGNSLMFLRSWLDKEDHTTATAIEILDVRSGVARKVAGTDNWGPPELSPDGRYIAAQSGDFQSLIVLDRQSGAQRSIAQAGFVHLPKWSRDGRFLYYQDPRAGEDQPVYRVALSGGKPEEIASRKQFLRGDVGRFSLIALTPDDQPVAVVIRPNADVYSMELERK